ncbi:MAG TPA: hypothetical protein VMU87_15765 [Stellaceae bacterium]|nr:hypothetical protein [Stellaceae bacterium]
MTRLLRSLTAALALALAIASPAQADFYSLAGRFQCLDKPGAVCYDATPSLEPPLPAQRPTPPLPKPPDVTQARAAPPPETVVAPPAPPRPLDPILAIAARIKADRPDPGDLDMLRRAAALGDPRAIELLAWCALRGIGTSPDAVAAYFLYGEAAAAAVPHARENQTAVYERALTPDERQHVLDIAAVPDGTQRVKQFLLSANGLDSVSQDVP